MEAAEEESEAERREAAARLIQSGVRRWLVARQSPVWSRVISQPRVISEERARHLRSVSTAYGGIIDFTKNVLVAEGR